MASGPSGEATDSYEATARPPFARISLTTRSAGGVRVVTLDAATEVVDDDRRAAARQLEGVGTTETAPGARDDGDAIVEANLSHPRSH